jgi:hypothetical protein
VDSVAKRSPGRTIVGRLTLMAGAGLAAVALVAGTGTWDRTTEIEGLIGQFSY